MNNLFFLLMAPPAEGQQGGGGWQMLIFFVAIILIFWLFMIRPQQKRQKKVQEAREALKKGDHVVTVGGIHGKISEVQDTTFIIEVDEGVKLKVEKAAIAIDENGANKK
ncbi:MAG: preprotein translocase subunit YajC [Bacteroidales bacterium]|nr:preprotein translocase subunit YajC [Bacteroidales bacterium]